MKPSELYARTPERITHGVSDLFGCYFNHVPEINEFQHHLLNNEETKRITIHQYKYFGFDGRRIWLLAGVKFNDDFVMIIQNAGREGDDHAARFVTDSKAYNEMIAYIRQYLPVEEVDALPLDQDIPGLACFYGNELDGQFTRY